MKIDCFGSSCVGSSGINGDVFYISPDRKLLLLADGASGAGKEGKVLMGKICIETAKEFDFLSSGLNPKDYLHNLIYKINNKLIEVSQKYNSIVFGTIVLVVFHNDEITVTSLGDSPAYYFDGEKTVRVAKNPKKYEWMISEGFITEEQYKGYISNMNPMMWSCFDNFIPMVVPNNVIQSIKIKSNDILVLCCDGISDWISADAIISEVKNKELENGVQGIIKMAKEKAVAESNYFDDLTIIAVRWS